MPHSTVMYLIGFVIAIAGLAWLAHLAGIHGEWIGGSVVVLLGVGIAGAAKRLGKKEPPPPPPALRR